MDNYVLVIDDETGIRDSFQLALEDSGYDVRTAADGEAGIKAAKEKTPILIFLDLKMPGIDGVETLRRLHKVCPDTPVYIVTAFFEEYMKKLQAIQEEGIDCEVCHKPLSGDQIKMITNGILRSNGEKDVNLNLKLYIAGNTPSSLRALEGVKKIFEEKLICKYDLQVLDVLQNPQLAEKDKIIATPTLVYVHSTRNRMIIGDLSNAEKVLEGLDLPFKGLIKGQEEE